MCKNQCFLTEVCPLSVRTNKHDIYEVEYKLMAEIILLHKIYMYNELIQSLIQTTRSTSFPKDLFLYRQCSTSKTIESEAWYLEGSIDVQIYIDYIFVLDTITIINN